MDYELAQTRAREDVIAVLDGTEEERREQLAKIAVWAVGCGRGIARADATSAPGTRRITVSEAALEGAGWERAMLLADLLRQARATA